MFLHFQRFQHFRSAFFSFLPTNFHLFFPTMPFQNAHFSRVRAFRQGKPPFYFVAIYVLLCAVQDAQCNTKQSPFNCTSVKTSAQFYEILIFHVEWLEANKKWTFLEEGLTIRLGELERTFDVRLIIMHLFSIRTGTRRIIRFDNYLCLYVPSIKRHFSKWDETKFETFSQPPM